MKRLILALSLLVTVIAGAMAQNDAMYVYRNDGKFNVFFKSEIDSMSYSHYDVDSVYHNEWQTQIVYTADRTYYIPLAVIDSISFTAPQNPEEIPDERYYNDYVKSVGDISEIIGAGLIKTNKDLLDRVKGWDNVTSVSESAGIGYVNFKGNWNFMIDMDGRCVASDENLSDFDIDDLDEELSELEEFLFSLNDDKEAKSRSISSDKVVPATFRILHWSPVSKPGVNEALRSICDHASVEGKIKVVLESKIGKSAKLSDLKSFGNYDLVFFEIHGNEEGKPAIPLDLEGLPSSIKPKLGYINDVARDSYDNYYFMADYDFLIRYLPDLSSTVLWTLMCFSHAENSTLAFAARSRNAADFFGSTAEINAPINLKFFSPFLYRLYRGITSSDAFIPGATGTSYEFQYSGHKYSGVFGHSGFPGICFPLHYVLPAQNSLPVACWYTPIGMFNQLKDGNKLKAGIQLENTETNEKTQILLNETNIDSDVDYKYKDILEGHKCSFKIDGLKPGVYEYKSFIKYADGRISFSSTSHNLTITGPNAYFCPDGNHPHAIDLGLPSGTKWSCCNVGASSPSDYGDYYAWGETTTKSEYTYENCKTWEKSIGDISGNPDYDAARANWGGSWRLPSKAEFAELWNECTKTGQGTIQGGYYGCKVIGPNDNSIFLPAAGYRSRSSLSNAGGRGYYWSSTPIESDTQGAYDLYIIGGYHFIVGWSGRYYGQSVRPVSE